MIREQSFKRTVFYVFVTEMQLKWKLGEIFIVNWQAQPE